MDIRKKRVMCLYRVSTKQQVTEDDIPMQRNACLEFISKQNNWEFVGEYVEKGVSGFKIKAGNREVLEQLKMDALEKKFDILLVFMFDRLGRIEEETPFVLKWFVEHNIEMWSVNEGQRVFDNHIDNLLNYITFWQAEGESKKIQTRTLEAKRQMAEEGRFLGHTPAYGYKSVSIGKHNAKGREIKKLVIDENEAEVVQKIFDLVTIKGFGSRRIAKELNALGMPTKRGEGYQWAGTTILGILKNSIYKGYFLYGRNTVSSGKRKYKNQSDCLVSDIKHEELVIISEEQWEEVQIILASRANKVKSNIPKQTNSPLLFTGYIYCKICGSKMTLHYSYSKYTRKDGIETKKKIPYYVCYARENGQNGCKSKYYYSEKIERIVLSEVYAYLDRIEKVDLSIEILEESYKTLKKLNYKIKSKEDNTKNLENELKILNNEVIKVLNGESVFTDILLMNSIKETSQKLEQINNEILLLQNEVDKSNLKISKYKELEKSIPIWKDELYDTDRDTKKMLLSKLIERIEVDEDEIKIKFKMKLDEFLRI